MTNLVDVAVLLPFARSPSDAIVISRLSLHVDAKQRAGIVVDVRMRMDDHVPRREWGGERKSVV